MYDVTDDSTFEHLERWKSEFLSIGGPHNASSFPFVIIGNKTDMVSSQEQVRISIIYSHHTHPFLYTHLPLTHLTNSNQPPLPNPSQRVSLARVQEWATAQDQPNIVVFETSAKTSDNVNAAFEAVVRSALKQSPSSVPLGGAVQLDKKKGKKKCC